MSYHILSAGLIPAHAHAVYLPSLEGLARGSQAFFFSPSPDTRIEPPIKLDKLTRDEDDGVVPSPINIDKIWKPEMRYTDWNEAVVKGFKKVFFNE